MQIEQDAKYGEHDERLVKLCRVQMQIRAVGADDRYTRVFMPGLGKMHAPRQVGRLSPTAARRKAALPAERLPERETWHEGVGNLPERQLVDPCAEHESQKSADQPAVKHT